MKLKSIFMDVIMTFFITLAVSVVITILWNLVIEERGAVVDWKTSFPLAIIMGIVLPVSRRKK
jgi:hypothetical protein